MNVRHRENLSVRTEHRPLVKDVGLSANVAGGSEDFAIGHFHFSTYWQMVGETGSAILELDRVSYGENPSFGHILLCVIHNITSVLGNRLLIALLSNSTPF